MFGFIKSLMGHDDSVVGTFNRRVKSKKEEKESKKEMKKTRDSAGEVAAEVADSSGFQSLLKGFAVAWKSATK